MPAGQYHRGMLHLPEPAHRRDVEQLAEACHAGKQSFLKMVRATTRVDRLSTTLLKKLCPLAPRCSLGCSLLSPRSSPTTRTSATPTPTSCRQAAHVAVVPMCVRPGDGASPEASTRPSAQSMPMAVFRVLVPASLTQCPSSCPAVRVKLQARAAVRSGGLVHDRQHYNRRQ